MRQLTRFLILCLTSMILALPAQAAEEDVMIVLDASGSMWGQIDGKSKMTIARDVMSKVLTDLDGKANIGVVTYGHRKKGDCGDIETIIPVGKVDHTKYMAVINKLSPKGKTPITSAVSVAAKELRFTEQKATVVLISDGLETCEADPCALAKQLESQGIDFTVHVVGFDLKGKDISSLQCLAKETGGKYLAADNADELGNAIGTVVAEAPAPKPEPVVVEAPKPQPAAIPTTLKVDVLLAPGSKPLDRAYVYIIPEIANKDRKKAAATGPASRIHKVQPGKYIVTSQVSRIDASAEIEVKTGEENRVELVLNAGLLSVDAVPDEGGEPIQSAYIYVYEVTPQTSGKRKRISGAHQRTIFTLPAGKYYVTATQGKAMAGQEVEIVAGKKTDTIIVLASGLLKISVLEQEGGKPQTSGGVYVYIFEDEKQADGSRKAITYANPRKPFSLPAGRYYVEARIGRARVGKSIEVVAGKKTDMEIVVGAGALKTTAIPVEGGKPLKKAYVKIFEIEKSLDGSRKLVVGANQKRIFKIAAGRYFVTAQIGKAMASGEVEITAGKLAELTINLNAGALQVVASKKVYVNIYSGDKNLDGTRDHIGSHRPGKPFMLPQGKYFLIGKEANKTAEAEVEIKAGKLTEVTLKP